MRTGNPKSERSCQLPLKTRAVGSVFSYDGCLYKVVERFGVEKPSDACRGCSFARGNCPSCACSGFDRRDGLSVWFVKII